jgi:hypothetical protein
MQAQIDNFMEMAKGMVGKIPGLLSVETGKAMEITKQFNQGYECGLVLIFDGPKFIGPYLDHPAHKPYVILTFLCSSIMGGQIGLKRNTTRLYPLCEENFQGRVNPCLRFRVLNRALLDICLGAIIGRAYGYIGEIYNLRKSPFD